MYFYLQSIFLFVLFVKIPNNTKIDTKPSQNHNTMKDFKQFLQHYCEKTGNHFLEYSDSIAIITLQLPNNRKQEVHSYLITRDGIQLVEFMSKVFDIEKHSLDYKEILQLNQQWCCYSRFVLFGGMLQCAASAHYAESSEIQMAAMLEEVGKLADQMEEEVTGEDVF